MSIHVRLRQLILSENISVSHFEEEIGVGKNTIATILRKQSAISHIILEKIKLRYSDYSLCWLVAGKTENDEMIDCLENLKSKVNDIFDQFESKLNG